MKKVSDILKGGQQIIEAGIKQQLRDQGHYLTGQLERSLKGQITNSELNGEALDYLLKLEKGVSANQIRIDSEALADMTTYVQLRMGYQGSKAMRVAYLILKKQSKEGMPTKNSRQFSKTGERKNAVKNAFSNTEEKLDNYILSGIDDIINEEFNKQKTETI